MATAKLNIKINLDLATAAFDKVTNQIKKSIQNIKGVDVKIGADDSEIKKKFKDVPKDAEKAGDAAAKKFGSSFSGGVKKLLAGAAIFSVLAVGASAIKGATTEFKTFNSALQNVESLGVKNIDSLGKALNNLSKTTVGSTTELTNALYDTVSAGIQGSQEQLVSFVDKASKVAVAGNATSAEAVKGLSSVLNSYSLGVEQTGKVSDIFFGTIKNGVTTFGEMNASLAAVLPAASAAGIKFEELAGNIAQMTSKGVPAQQATTQLRSAIIELQKPGKDLQTAMSGVTVTLDGVSQSLNENNIGAVLEKQGLTKTLQQIEQSATSSGKSLTQVFSSAEAGSAALLLTGKNAESANQQLQNIKQGIEDGVSTSAFEAQFKSLDNQMKLVQQNIQAGFNTIFTALLPVVNGLLKTIIPIIQKIFDGIIPVIEQLATVIGPVLNGILELIQPVIDLLAGTLAPLIVKVIGSVIGLLQPLAALLAPIFGAINQVVAELSPLIDGIIVQLTGVIGELITSLVPIIKIIANLFAHNLGNALKVVLLLVSQMLTKYAAYAETIGELIVAITPLIEIVAKLSAEFSVFITEILLQLVPIMAEVLTMTIQLAGGLIKVGLAVGKFLGLVDEKAPTKLKPALEDIADGTDEVIESTKEMNKELANDEGVKNNKNLNKSLGDTGKATKDNTKYVVEYFKAFKDGKDEAERMAKIEDEISRIRAERSKNTNDELVEQQREISILIDQRNKLQQSLKDGFVINDAGKKLNIKAEERIDLTETLKNLNTDILFASKESEKLQVQIKVDANAAERETIATIKELQRERLEIEVDMAIKPKTDLLQAYQQDLIALNVAIVGAESIEQEKLQNDRLKKLKQIQALQNEMNESVANKAALAYSKSFNAVIDNFTKALDDSFKSIEPNTDRVDAIKEEIKSIDERKAKVLSDYNDGILNAQQYNNKLVEIESERVNKINELNESQSDKFNVIAQGLGNAFNTLSSQYRDMALQNLASISELSKKEQEYQTILATGAEVPKELKDAHLNYSTAATDAFNNMAVAAGSTFAALLVQGKLSVKSIVALALDALDSIVPVLVAQIFGQSLAQLGPIGGALVSGASIAAFKGLVAVAKSSIGGANTGRYNLSESNKGKPGGNDSILMMVEPGESIATRKATKNNPVIKAIVKDGMNEEQYFNKFVLPKALAKHGISLPSMNMMVMPTAINDKAINEAKESAKRLNLLHDKYQKFDKENLAIAVKRERSANNEAKLQTEMLNNLLVQSKKDNELLRSDMNKLRRDFSSKQKVDVSGTFKASGDDMVAVLESKKRRILS